MFVTHIFLSLYSKYLTILYATYLLTITFQTLSIIDRVSQIVAAIFIIPSSRFKDEPNLFLLVFSGALSTGFTVRHIVYVRPFFLFRFGLVSFHFMWFLCGTTKF